jgi:hypothetical protein
MHTTNPNGEGYGDHLCQQEVMVNRARMAGISRYAALPPGRQRGRVRCEDGRASAPAHRYSSRHRSFAIRSWSERASYLDFRTERGVAVPICGARCGNDRIGVPYAASFAVLIGALTR